MYTNEKCKTIEMLKFKWTVKQNNIKNKNIHKGSKQYTERSSKLRIRADKSILKGMMKNMQ